MREFIEDCLAVVGFCVLMAVAVEVADLMSQ